MKRTTHKILCTSHKNTCTKLTLLVRYLMRYVVAQRRSKSAQMCTHLTFSSYLRRHIWRSLTKKSLVFKLYVTSRGKLLKIATSSPRFCSCFIEFCCFLLFAGAYCVHCALCTVHTCSARRKSPLPPPLHGENKSLD
jgi:hypothetical protein